jgi:hypothetical protein
MALGAEQLAEDHWYRVKVTRRGGLVLGAPELRRPVRLAERQVLTLVWRGTGDSPGAGLRRRGGEQVPTAGAFWNSYDVDLALIVYFEDVEVLEEVPDPLKRR